MAKKKPNLYTSKHNYKQSDTSAIPGDLVSTHEACPVCGSSDAMSIYYHKFKDEYQSYCFSNKCTQRSKTQDALHFVIEGGDDTQSLSTDVPSGEVIAAGDDAPKPAPDMITDGEYRDIPSWKISKKVCEEFSTTVKIETHSWGVRREILAGYHDAAGNLVAQKSRIQTLNYVLDAAGEPLLNANGSHVFESNGDGSPKWEYIKSKNGKDLKCVWHGVVASATLFGMERAKRMGEKRIAVCEGEKDAKAFAEMLEKIPVVSVKNGASGAEADAKAHFQFFNNYDEIYVIGDNDDAGKEMNAAFSALFPRKCKVVNLGNKKDVQDFLAADEIEAFRICFWNAKRQVPQIVKPISALAPLLFEEDPPCYCTYPWSSFNDKLGGIHLGEVVGVLAHEKVGKTSLLRNMAHHVWKETDDPVGVIFLEDVKKDLIKGIVSLHLGINLNKKGVKVPEDLLYKAANEVCEGDRFYFKAEGGPGEIENLMSVIDWMIAVGCKVIFFDNVSTLIVGDTASDNERQGIDNLIVACRDRATAHEVCIFVVQHLNRQGFPRGSHALPIFASTTLELIRDADSEDEIAKNTTEIRCRGNRRYGFRGEVALLNYEHDTSYLTELNQNAILEYQQWKERVKEESKKRKD